MLSNGLGLFLPAGAIPPPELPRRGTGTGLAARATALAGAGRVGKGTPIFGVVRRGAGKLGRGGAGVSPSAPPGRLPGLAGGVRPAGGIAGMPPVLAPTNFEPGTCLSILMDGGIACAADVFCFRLISSSVSLALELIDSPRGAGVGGGGVSAISGFERPEPLPRACFEAGFSALARAGGAGGGVGGSFGASIFQPSA